MDKVLEKENTNASRININMSAINPSGKRENRRRDRPS